MEMQTSPLLYTMYHISHRFFGLKETNYTVWMPDLSQELHLWRIEWIVLGKLELCREDATLVRSALRPLDQSLPDEQIILTGWSSGDTIRRVRQKRLVLLEKSLGCHAGAHGEKGGKV
jgi:hypothetical protein